MSTFETTYCNTTTDLLFVEPNLGSYDGKRVIPSNFTTTDTSNLYQLNNSGFVDQLYKDGVEMTKVTDTPNADNEYNYSSSTDSFQFFLSSSSEALGSCAFLSASLTAEVVPVIAFDNFSRLALLSFLENAIF